jgi:hypothetical protein
MTAAEAADMLGCADDCGVGSNSWSKARPAPALTVPPAREAR